MVASYSRQTLNLFQVEEYTRGGMAWQSVEKDDDNVVTVVVEDEDVSCFPKFMHAIIQAGIGLEKGYFKIRFNSSTGSLTTLAELQTYISDYLNTKQLVTSADDCSEEIYEFPSIARQTFFYGHENEHVYGYRSPQQEPQDAGKIRKNIVTKLKKHATFSSVTQCMKMQEISKEMLLKHYWETIRNVSVKSVGMDCGDEEPNLIGLREMAKSKRAMYCFSNASRESEYTESNVNEDLKSFKKSFVKKQTIVYPSGIPVEKSFPITANFSLSKLRTLLDLHPQKVAGVTDPFLYVGVDYASFPWHIEDAALFSLNYLHYGADCVWFFIPPEYFKSFTEWAKYFPLDLTHVSCVNILGGGHKYILASSDFLKKIGIPVDVVIQKRGEVIVIYPFTLHSGFKTGWNIQEAVNFADECDYPTVLKMDLKVIIAVCKEDLLEKYVQRDFLGLLKRLSSNPFIRRLGLLPSYISTAIKEPGTSLPMMAEECPVVPEDLAVEDETLYNIPEEAVLHNKAKSVRRTNRLVLECPLCDQKYEGGFGRINRLIKHIKARHPSDNFLVKEVLEKYSPKTKQPKYFVICEICGEQKVGGKAHLKIHVARMHPGTKYPSKL